MLIFICILCVLAVICVEIILYKWMFNKGYRKGQEDTIEKYRSDAILRCASCNKCSSIYTKVQALE